MIRVKRLRTLLPSSEIRRRIRDLPGFSAPRHGGYYQFFTADIPTGIEGLDVHCRCSSESKKNVDVLWQGRKDFDFIFQYALYSGSLKERPFYMSLARIKSVDSLSVSRDSNDTETQELIQELCSELLIAAELDQYASFTEDGDLRCRSRDEIRVRFAPPKREPAMAGLRTLRVHQSSRTSPTGIIGISVEEAPSLDEVAGRMLANLKNRYSIECELSFQLPQDADLTFMQELETACWSLEVDDPICVTGNLEYIGGIKRVGGKVEVCMGNGCVYAGAEGELSNVKKLEKWTESIFRILL